MAEIDKNNLINMLGNILGEDKKDTVDSILNSLNTQDSTSNTSDNLQLINTAEVMSKVTNIMDKLNHSKNNREFALLSAIRPYMRDNRKATIDTCMRMLQVYNVMNEMKKEG